MRLNARTPRTSWTLIMLAVGLACGAQVALVDPSRGFAIDSMAATQRAARLPRVRAEDPLLSAAISQGAERSTTFRRLLEAIDATDGLVYVTDGTCGQGVRACLHMSVELAGANRLLPIFVNPRRAAGCELIASIGHELQHALEALFALFSYVHGIGREGSHRFETEKAIQMELAVAQEVCRKAGRCFIPCVRWTVRQLRSAGCGSRSPARRGAGTTRDTVSLKTGPGSHGASGMPDDASPHHFWKTRNGSSEGHRAETVEPAAKTAARSQPDVTRLLEAVRHGDREALNELYSLVYAELRVLAHRQRRRWDITGTMNTTALVHEAYLKLVNRRQIDTATPDHFFALAATAMRHIISNYARDRRARKRGDGVRKISLSELAVDPPGSLSLSEEHVDLLVGIDEALERLDRVNPRQRQVVECRFFGGMTAEETAAALGISSRTVKRDWALAQAWLYRELRDRV
jgi:RNA polymerase sigma factor (TIGR02999 family)